MALHNNQAIAAASAGEKASTSRISQARAGRLPKLEYSESWIRSDNPVFVFSSLLSQHQFGEQNFLVGPLNRPDFLNNFQSQLTVEQNVYDAGKTRHAGQSAEISRQISAETRRRATDEVIAATARAYYDAVLSAEELKAAEQAVRSAEADLRRANAVRAAGLSTDVDVLSIRVHLAAVDEQRIRRSADLDVARAALNDVLALPLDAPHTLTSPLSRAAVSLDAVTDYEGSAIQQRPEAHQAQLFTKLAKTQADDARSALLPQAYVRGGFEADRQRFYDRGGANWSVSAGLHWNLFNGFADRSRIEETKTLVQKSEAEKKQTDSSIRLQVRRAWADLTAAEQRIEAARAVVAEAEESLRITQNRYEAGLSTVTDLLRTETAVLESRTRYLAAIHDQRIAATMLELASGRLNADSEVLN